MASGRHDTAAKCQSAPSRGQRGYPNRPFLSSRHVVHAEKATTDPGTEEASDAFLFTSWFTLSFLLYK